MRRAIAALAITAATLPGVAQAAPHCRGHIAAGGPWATQRTFTVLLDQNSVDGFFCEAPPAGTWIRATVTRNGACGPYEYCAPFDLNINFHGTERGLFGRDWKGGCNRSDVAEPVCQVRAGAATLEVAAALGADLDVGVEIVPAPAGA